MERIDLFKSAEITQSKLSEFRGGENSWCEESYCTEQNGCSDVETTLYDESGAMVCHRIVVDCCEPVT